MGLGSPIFLVLDLDETFIHATEEPLGHEHEFAVGPYVAYRHPHLAEFLVYCSTSFRLAVWSSASDDYVRDVVGQIVPPGAELAFARGRSRCVRRLDPESYETEYLKDLKKVKRLGYDLRRVLIIDDTSSKVRRHHSNAVYVPPFTGNPEDRTLTRLRSYLTLLRDEPNVRIYTGPKRSGRGRRRYPTHPTPTTQVSHRFPPYHIAPAYLVVSNTRHEWVEHVQAPILRTGHSHHGSPSTPDRRAPRSHTERPR